MVNIFTETTVSVLNPLQAVWLRIVEVLPYLIAAIVVLIIGCFIAAILGHALRIILEKTKLDEWVRKAKLTKAVGHTHLPSLLGELFKWYIIIIFLQAAIALLNLGTLSDLLNRFVLWLPNLLIAVIIFLAGLAAAHFVQIKISEYSRMKGVLLGAAIVKWVIVIMVALVALRQIGVDVSIVENILLVIIGALAIGVALALGIGLGLGLKKESEGFIQKIKKNL